MHKMGMAGDAIEQLVCPIGLATIRDKAPAVIAASVVTQVLMRREEMHAQAANSADANSQPGRARHG
jgi:xanthine/CO dehydrogenase XdhC/CoxF family maturation factor